MTELDNVTVKTAANIYFDGKCVSHTVIMADGARKTLGVIFPGSLTFSTGEPEKIDIVAGSCKVRLPGAAAWTSYVAGQSFSVPGENKFDIETTETLHYICHFG